MKVFVNTYLLHGSIETAQLNLQAFVELPPPPPHMSATSEKAMWKVMSWPNGATTGNQTSSNPPRVVSNPASPVFTPPSPTASALVTRVDNMTSSYAGSESNSRPSTPPLSIASPGPSLVLPPAYESLPPISDSDTPSRQHSTDRTTRRIGEYSDTRSDRNLNNRQLQAPTSSLASHDQGHIRRSDHSSSTQSGDMDTSMQFSNGISQHLSDPTNSPSRFQRPLPPTPASAGSTTPRRPDFVLRLQALRDCKYAGAVHNGWLRYKKSEILYTDGKKFNVIYGPRNKVSHTAVMAQNSHGNCGLVDPGKSA
ncbi:hypothetical protein BD410DRAFT_461962 [Rickenella mellea]|uniref:Uncharacterized protein n=1 Tax=Rickenella mellea TaxID=50990 RepID=A0A4Y7PW88_9AGAM|nr:hypothetical protein BD410DRAFT_461962 [Rickenella mellea]